MRAVSLITGPSTHLDHLGVLSSLLDIPLIVTEEKTYQLAKQYYPELNVALKDLSALTYGYFAENFEIIFQSGKFFTAEFKPFIDLLFQKKMRFVFCPHGNSDKGHSLATHPEQDISLVYGQHLFDHLDNTGAASSIQQIFRTGNYRYTYYLKHRSRFDQIVEEHVFSNFKETQPAILYAPTWNDKENPSSFFLAIHTLIEELCSSFNLVIKLHPFMLQDHPAEIDALIKRYEEHPAAHFLIDFPPIYPLLARCDLYLGDYSSIGYDFLTFDKPLYFLHSQDSPPYRSVLQQCGLAMDLDKIKNIKTFIENTLEESQIRFQKERKKTYLYTFDQNRCLDELKNEILNSLTHKIR